MISKENKCPEGLELLAREEGRLAVGGTGKICLREFIVKNSILNEKELFLIYLALFIFKLTYGQDMLDC